MKICPTCKSEFSGPEVFCPNDGTRLDERPVPGALVSATLAGLVKLERLEHADAMGERYSGRLLDGKRSCYVTVFNASFSPPQNAPSLVEAARARVGSPVPRQLTSLITVNFSHYPPFLIETAPRGPSLRVLLDQRRQLDWKVASKLTANVARVVEWLAERGVTHHGIHPSSVFVTDLLNARVQLGEWYSEDAQWVDNPMQTLASTPGRFVGYVSYMGPELAMKGRAGDLRSAVYALGVLLYELIVGRPPFTDPNPAEVLRRHITEQPMRLSSARGVSQVPEDLELVLGMMLEKDPAKRFQAPAAIIGALATLMDVDPLELAPLVEQEEVDEEGDRSSAIATSSIDHDPSPELANTALLRKVETVHTAAALAVSPEVADEDAVHKTLMFGKIGNAVEEEARRRAEENSEAPFDQRPSSGTLRMAVPDFSALAEPAKSDVDGPKTMKQQTTAGVSEIADDDSTPPGEAVSIDDEGVRSDATPTDPIPGHASDDNDVARDEARDRERDRPSIEIDVSLLQEAQDAQDAQDRESLESSTSLTEAGLSETHPELEAPPLDDGPSIIVSPDVAQDEEPSGVEASPPEDMHASADPPLISADSDPQATLDAHAGNFTQDSKPASELEPQEPEPDKPAKVAEAEPKDSEKLADESYDGVEDVSTPKFEIGFLPSKSSDASDVSDAWFSSGEPAWDRQLDEEHVRESERRNNMTRNVVLGVLFVVVIAFVLYVNYGNFDEESGDEPTTQATVQQPAKPEFDVAEQVATFNRHLESGRLVAPFGNCALSILEKTKAEAPNSPEFETMRKTFVERASKGADLAERADDLNLARTLAGYASQWAPEDALLKARADALQARYVGTVSIPGAQTVDAGAAEPSVQADAAQAPIEVPAASTTTIETTVVEENAAMEPAKTDGAETIENVENVEKTARPTKADQPTADSRKMLNDARSAYARGDVDTARSLYEQLLKMDGGNHLVQAGLGQVYFDQARYDDAATHQLQAVKLKPARLEYRINLGQSYFRLGRFKEAISVWEEVLKQDPDNANAKQYIDLAKRKLN